MKNNTYLVKLEPAGYYFFGGDNTFNTNRKDKYGKPVSNYFAISNTMPQQTAILGLLRHALLVLTNKLNAPTEGAGGKSEIIGDTGFNEKAVNSYGWINSISPLVILKKQTNCFSIFKPAGFDCQAYNNFKPFNYKLNNTADKFVGAVKKDNELEKLEIPELKDFNYKNDINLNWTDGNTFLKSDEVFKSLEKVGVDINNTDDAFYKTKSIGLHKGYSFGVWLTLTAEADTKVLRDIIMPFGAEQGNFKLSFIKDVENDFNEQNLSNKTKMVLLSDAWITPDIFESIDYSISKYVSFRYINSKTSNYYKGVNKTEKSKLMQRGSTIYSQQMSNITNSLSQQSVFRKIGYNYFKLI